MKTVVRRANLEDVSRLIELNSLFNGIKVSFKSVANSLSKNGSEHVFVAELDSEIVGFIAMGIHYSFCYEQPNAEITELFVIEKARRNGISKQLLGAALNLSEKFRVDELYIRTNPENQAANALYMGSGLKLKNTNTYYSA